METTWVAIASFLFGVCVTVIGYALPLSTQLAKLSTKLEEHCKQPTVVCAAHGIIAEKVTTLEANDKQRERDMTRGVSR